MILVAVSDLYLWNFILRNEMQTEAACENLALSFQIPVYVSVFDHSTCSFLSNPIWKIGRTSALSSKQLFLDLASVHLPRTIWQSHGKLVFLTHVTAMDVSKVQYAYAHFY